LGIFLTVLRACTKTRSGDKMKESERLLNVREVGEYEYGEGKESVPTESAILAANGLICYSIGWWCKHWAYLRLIACGCAGTRRRHDM
jgi:hypothetical protein